MHRRCFGNTDHTAYETFDPRPQVDVFALNSLRMLLANLMMLGVNMPLVHTPSIRVKAVDAKGLQQRLQLQKDRSFVAQNIRQHGAPVVMLGGDKARSVQARLLIAPV